MVRSTLGKRTRSTKDIGKNNNDLFIIAKSTGKVQELTPKLEAPDVSDTPTKRTRRQTRSSQLLNDENVSPEESVNSDQSNCDSDAEVPVAKTSPSQRVHSADSSKQSKNILLTHLQRLLSNRTCCSIHTTYAEYASIPRCSFQSTCHPSSSGHVSR